MIFTSISPYYESNLHKFFKYKLSIVEFLKKVYRNEKITLNITVIGLDNLLYHSINYEILSKKVRSLLQDVANFFFSELSI